MRRLGLLLLLSLTLIGMSSQTHFDGMVTLGAKGGVTLSRMQFSPSVPQRLLPGAVIGACFRYVEERHFGLIAELNIEQRGWRENYEETGFSYQRRFTYLQLPLLTHIYFGGTRVKGFFNAGPELGYMLARSTSANFDYSHFAEIDGFPIANRHNEQLNLPIKSKFDYGISAGIGMELNITRRQSLMLEGRFYYGLRDVFSNHKADPFSGSSGMSAMVTLGYYWQIR